VTTPVPKRKSMLAAAEYGIVRLLRRGERLLRDAREAIEDRAAARQAPTADGLARELAAKRWREDIGDQTLRQEYPLSAQSIVFDVGGFRGQWASDIYARYRCTVYLFEPVPEFAAAISARFAANPAIVVYPAALGVEDGEIELRIAEDASSAFGEGGQRLVAPVLGLRKLLENQRIDDVALMKMNIEGGEYALLEGMLDAGLMPRIGDLQVQFHDFFPDAPQRMAAIQRRLSETHELTYQYVFAWENWRRKNPSATGAA